MSRLIDVDMVRQGKFCLNPLHADKDDTYYYQLGWNSAIETICDCVPTVEPKHGHWDNKLIGCGYYSYTIARCSVCRGRVHVFAKDYIVKYPYCPLCGAKMDEVEE